MDELEKENIRSFAALEGEIAFSVVKASNPAFPSCAHCPMDCSPAKQQALALQGKRE